MKGSFETWEDFRKTLDISQEEDSIIQLEVELIEATIKARESANMTQRELAEKSGMKQSAIARIETMINANNVISNVVILYSFH